MGTILPRSDSPRTAGRRRVLIVDDHPFFAACLRSLLENEPDLLVCDIAPDAENLGERVARVHPDLLVIDLALGAESGLESAARLRQMSISIPILFVSTLGCPAPEELAAIDRSTFIPKSRKPAEFLTAVRDALEPSLRLPDVHPDATACHLFRAAGKASL